MSTDNPTLTGNPDEMTAERTDGDRRTAAVAQALREQASAETVPSGVLLELSEAADVFDSYDGSADAPAIDAKQWLDAWDLLKQSRVGSVSFGDDDIQALSESVRADGALPILIADIAYQRARPRWGAVVNQAAESKSESEPPRLPELIRNSATLLASAQPSPEVDLFTLRAGKQYGLEAKFMLPADGYRTNTDRTLSAASIDFGDGVSHPLAVGTPLAHVFGDFGTHQVTVLLETSDDACRSAKFELEVAPLAPTPGAIWQHGPGILDRAYVYYGLEGGQPRRKLEKPMLLADGFPGGRNIHQLWPMVNQSDTVNKLRRRGHDVIIVGFQDGTYPIQSNATLYMRCVDRAIREKANTERLAAGGASMGGLIARYALCQMESLGLDHQVGLFYTVDTPHYGANIPVSVQAFVQLYASHNSSTQKQADLMSSMAARQMLLQWIPPRSEWRNGGRYPMASPERGKFLADLRAKGWMPQKVARKAGIADGVATGTGNGVPAGAKAFWFECTIFAWANMWASQDAPAKIVSMNRGADSWDWIAGSQRIDGSPGGTRDTWKEVHDAVGNVRREVWHPTHSFVPSTSACAISGDLYRPVALGNSELDTFKTSSTTNLGHVALPPELSDYLVEEISRPLARSSAGVDAVVGAETAEATAP